MARRKSRAVKISVPVLIIIILLVVATLATLLYLKTYKPDIYDKYIGKYIGDTAPETYEIAASESLECALLAEGELKIHFLELGNDKAGDCVYIQAGDNDILVDAGSTAESIATIRTYLDTHVTDGVLEYVIITHAHEDHYAGFATNESTQSLFDIYECENVIAFPKTNKTENNKMHKDYLRELDEELNRDAAKSSFISAEKCLDTNNGIIALADDIDLQILDSYYYYNESDTENDYSVCFTVNHGERRFLFTGDLEAQGERKLVEMNELDNVVLYKAGHHGSKTSSSSELMAAIKPQIVCVTCVAGAPEYTDKLENQFPTQKFVDNVSPYTSRVYVTSLWDDTKEDDHEPMNGTIVVVSSPSLITLNFTNNNIRLKDSEWFKEYRTCPVSWK